MNYAMLTICGLVAVLSGCANTQSIKPPSAMSTAAPRSILVVPAINKSLYVDGPNTLLTTLPVPLAEKGYYVFPVHTTKFVLEQEGLFEGDQIHQQPPAVLAKLFGADAILYVTIKRWDTKYVILNATVTVEFEYRIVAKDGAEVWRATQSLQHSPQQNNAGSPLANLVASALSAALTRAAPNYLPLVRQANEQVLISGPNAIPSGPYDKLGP
jgi:hypothetical protein